MYIFGETDVLKKHDTVFLPFWMGLSVFVIFFSHRYGIGSFNNPGPGFMPFLLGIFLLVICSFFLLTSVFQKIKKDQAPNQEQGQTNIGPLSVVLGALFFYAFFLEILGYLIVTLVTLILLFRTAGLKRWSSALVAAVLTTTITYSLFTLLGLRFPSGIIGFLSILS
jgi:hypothetical protein